MESWPHCSGRVSENRLLLAGRVTVTTEGCSCKGQLVTMEDLFTFIQGRQKVINFSNKSQQKVINFSHSWCSCFFGGYPAVTNARFQPTSGRAIDPHRQTHAGQTLRVSAGGKCDPASSGDLTYGNWMKTSIKMAQINCLLV